MADDQIITLTADIVSAHLANNNVATADVPALIQSVFSALSMTAEPTGQVSRKQEPAVPIRTSVKPDYIVCLEDGKKLTMLKRYLRTNYNMTPDDYRAKWGLPRDYPMVAPNYTEKRRTLAKAIGLGRKKAADVAEPIAAPVKRSAKKSDAAGKVDATAKKPGRKRLGIQAAKDAAQAHLGTGSEASQANLDTAPETSEN